MNKGIELKSKIHEIEKEISLLTNRFWNTNSTSEVIKLKEELFEKECKINELRTELHNLY